MTAKVLDLDIDVSFKGGRDYLHGTDVFNYLSGLSTCVTNSEDAYLCKLIIRKLIKNKCRITDKFSENRIGVVGEVKFKYSNGRDCMDAWIVETNFIETRRRSYEEDKIIEFARLNLANHEVSVRHTSNFSLIEEVVALTKYLSYSVNPIEIGKWLFCQIDLNSAMPITCDLISVKMTDIILNKFNVNNIYIDNVLIGKITFIVGP